MSVKSFVEEKVAEFFADDQNESITDDDIDKINLPSKAVNNSSPAHFLDLDKDINPITIKIKSMHAHYHYKTIKPYNNNKLALEIQIACKYGSEHGANRFIIYW